MSTIWWSIHVGFIIKNEEIHHKPNDSKTPYRKSTTYATPADLPQNKHINPAASCTIFNLHCSNFFGSGLRIFPQKNINNNTRRHPKREMKPNACAHSHLSLSPKHDVTGSHRAHGERAYVYVSVARFHDVRPRRFRFRSSTERCCRWWCYLTHALSRTECLCVYYFDTPCWRWGAAMCWRYYKAYVLLNARSRLFTGHPNKGIVCRRTSWPRRMIRAEGNGSKTRSGWTHQRAGVGKCMLLEVILMKLFSSSDLGGSLNVPSYARSSELQNNSKHPLNGRVCSETSTYYCNHIRQINSSDKLGIRHNHDQLKTTAKITPDPVDDDDDDHLREWKNCNHFRLLITRPKSWSSWKQWVTPICLLPPFSTNT